MIVKTVAQYEDTQSGRTIIERHVLSEADGEVVDDGEGTFPRFWTMAGAKLISPQTGQPIAEMQGMVPIEAALNVHDAIAMADQASREGSKQMFEELKRRVAEASRPKLALARPDFNGMHRG